MCKIRLLYIYYYTGRSTKQKEADVTHGRVYFIYLFFLIFLAGMWCYGM